MTARVASVMVAVTVACPPSLFPKDCEVDRGEQPGFEGGREGGEDVVEVGEFVE